MNAREAATERTCIVTRQAMSPDAMIRFVAAPDGSAAPDIRRKLPGRGAWVTANRDSVVKAVRGRRLQKALELSAPVDPALADRVEDLLRDAAISALSMSRRAGVAVTGFVKVADAIAKGTALAVLTATDAGKDGRGKIESAVRRSPAGARTGCRAFGFGFRSHTCDTCSVAFRPSQRKRARQDRCAHPVSWQRVERGRGQSSERRSGIRV